MINSLNKEQLEVILGLYLFDNKKTNNTSFLNKFTSKFSELFKVNTNNQNISYILSYFKKYDSSYSAANKDYDKNDIFYFLWDYYVLQNREEELKEKYNNFKNGLITESYFYDDFTINKFLNNKNNFDIDVNIIDEPKELYELSGPKEALSRKRSLNVSINSLKSANYKCEYSESHETFLRKNSNIPYTEGHHLIPLEFQEKFKYNLDVEANVVSLCSTCHNNLHYGEGYKQIIKKLYEERKKRLLKCGFDLKLEDLIKMYE